MQVFFVFSLGFDRVKCGVLCLIVIFFFYYMGDFYQVVIYYVCYVIGGYVIGFEQDFVVQFRIVKSNFFLYDVFKKDGFVIWDFQVYNMWNFFI